MNGAPADCDTFYKEIKRALDKCKKDDDFSSAATELFALLGYKSERIPQQPEIREILLEKASGDREKKLLRMADSIRILFDYSEKEINKAHDLDSEFLRGEISSFYFIATKLRKSLQYEQDYDNFTRQINKGLPNPAIILFRSPLKQARTRLTLAAIGRRPNQRDSNRDVLLEVSKLHKIKPSNGFASILADLELSKLLQSPEKPQNFSRLLDLWLSMLKENPAVRYEQELSRRHQKLKDLDKPTISVPEEPPTSAPEEMPAGGAPKEPPISTPKEMPVGASEEPPMSTPEEPPVGVPEEKPPYFVRLYRFALRLFGFK